MNKPPTPPSLNKPSPGLFAKFAATFSIIAPVTAFLLVIILRHLPSVLNPLASALLTCLPPVLVMFGFISGALALLATRRSGQQNIFRRAVAGTLISGFCLLIFIIAVIGSECMVKSPPHQ